MTSRFLVPMLLVASDMASRPKRTASLCAVAMRDEGGGPLQVDKHAWIQDERCTSPCGKSVGYQNGTFFAVGEGHCLKDDSDGQCPGDDYDKFFARDLDTRGKRLCLYDCTRVTIPKNSMCCKRTITGVSGWVTPENQLQSRKNKCPKGFTEAETDDACGVYPQTPHTYSLNGAINQPHDGFAMHASCGLKCGQSIRYSNSFLSLGKDKCVLRAETCPEGTGFDKFWAEPPDEDGLRRCVYPCSKNEIPEGSMCCGNGWVLPAKLQTEEATGSPTCPEGNPTVGECDSDSPVA